MTSVLSVCVVLSICACSLKTKTEYTIVETNDTYSVSPYIHIGGEVDDKITLDGVLNESFYQGQNWMTTKKTEFGSRTAEVVTTTYFAENGLLIGSYVTDDYGLYYNENRVLGNNSYLEYFFANGSSSTFSDGFYQMIVDVGLTTRMISSNGSILFYFQDMDNDTAPSYAINFSDKDVNLTDGSAHSYTSEMYFSYELLGWDEQPESVYLSPVLLTSYDYEESENDWWLAANQLSFYSWLNTKMFTFDKDGFVSNSIEITSIGGTVAEEHGYNWSVTGDIVNIIIQADEGKTLTSFVVNGLQLKNSIVWDTNTGIGTYTRTSSGDLNIIAAFG